MNYLHTLAFAVSFFALAGGMLAVAGILLFMAKTRKTHEEAKALYLSNLIMAHRYNSTIAKVPPPPPKKGPNLYPVK